MAKGFKKGGGVSNPLNFKVVGGTTQPVSPKKNTIWIKTNTKISHYSFRIGEPTKTEGAVWITFGDSGTVSFNALKKNVLMVYPKSAKQCINGNWQNCEAYLYDGASWLQFSNKRYFLIDNGDISEVTGGWAVSDDSQYASGSTSIANSLYMTLDAPTASSSPSITMTQKKSIDVTDYKKLCIKWENCSYAAGSERTAGMGFKPRYSIHNGSTALESLVYSAPSGMKEYSLEGVSSLKLIFKIETNYYYENSSITLNAPQIWCE